MLKDLSLRDFSEIKKAREKKVIFSHQLTQRQCLGAVLELVQIK